LKSGLIASPNLWPKRIDDDYAFQWTGYIDIPADGEWTFFTSSDEGSQLWIGSTMVVNNDGLHTAREVSGKIKLKKGKHAFNVTFFEHLGSASIAVRWAGPGINKQVIASTAYYRIPSAATATSTRQGSPELIAIEVPAVYPNPAQFNIHVEVIADAGDPVDLSLVNIHGQQIKQQTFQANTNGSNIFTLPVDEIGNGIYEIRIQKGNGYKFKKVVIRK
jgi:hypothetical protein